MTTQQTQDAQTIEMGEFDVPAAQPLQTVSPAGQQIARQTVDEDHMVQVLTNSLYPNAAPQSVRMVLGYCRAAGLDPMQKPVHIVPMWDSQSRTMRDVVMPGIGLYRTQAARSGTYAGMSEPEFGPDVTENIGGSTITYPLWCKVVVRRMLPGGTIAEFPAKERWLENYAVKGGKERSIAPNSMWQRRPYGQISKCAEAQALRKAFPEFGAAPTAEEMEGRSLNDEAGPPQAIANQDRAADPPPPPPPAAKPFYTAEEFAAKEMEWVDKITNPDDPKDPDRLMTFVESKGKRFTDEQREKLRSYKAPF